MKNNVNNISIILDIWQIISDLCDFDDQISLLKVTKELNQNLRIYDFYNINNKYKQKLNNDILKRYKHIKYLDASSLVNSYFNNITNEGIKHLNLKVLNANYNVKITDDGIKHMVNLKKLYAKGICGITDKGIKNMNLEYLNITCNSKITDEGIGRMKLKTLIINEAYGGKCSITDNGILKISDTLEELGLSLNRKITNTSLFHCKKIKKLNLSYNSIITGDALKNLQLLELNLSGNHMITDYDIVKMSSLKKLILKGSCAVSNFGIIDLNLDYLDCSNNENINDFGLMNMNLSELYARDGSGISFNFLKNKKFSKIDVMNNKNINHKKLKKIDCSNIIGIIDQKNTCILI